MLFVKQKQEESNHKGVSQEEMYATCHCECRSGTGKSRKCLGKFLKDPVNNQSTNPILI